MGEAQKLSESGTREQSFPDSNPQATLSAGALQERKLLVGLAVVVTIALAVAFLEVSPAVRRTMIIFFAVGAAAFFLMAKFIVYSYNREKSRLKGPFHRDHIVK